MADIKKYFIKGVGQVAETTRRRCRTFQKQKDYFIRIKGKFKEEFIKWLDSVADAYQVALEGDNETNWHIQAVVKFKEAVKDVRKTIKEWLKSITEKVGNAAYSCVKCRENPIRAMAYNYKEDNEVVEKNVDPEDIEVAKKLSHGKSTKQFVKQMELIKEKYYRNELTTKGLVTDILLLKADYNQNIYMNHIEAQVRYIMIRKDRRSAVSMASAIVERIYS
jgi:hypothetical protein